MGRPSADHAGNPPFNTDTLGCPKARNIHQTRGAENIPVVSYSTTCVSLEMSKASHVAAKAAADGNM